MPHSCVVKCKPLIEISRKEAAIKQWLLAYRAMVGTLGIVSLKDMSDDFEKTGAFKWYDVEDFSGLLMGPLREHHLVQELFVDEFGEIGSLQEHNLLTSDAIWNDLNAFRLECQPDRVDFKIFEKWWENKQKVEVPSGPSTLKQAGISLRQRGIPLLISLQNDALKIFRQRIENIKENFVAKKLEVAEKEFSDEIRELQSGDPLVEDKVSNFIKLWQGLKRVEMSEGLALLQVWVQLYIGDTHVAASPKLQVVWAALVHLLRVTNSERSPANEAAVNSDSASLFAPDAQGDLAAVTVAMRDVQAQVQEKLEALSNCTVDVEVLEQLERDVAPLIAACEPEYPTMLSFLSDLLPEATNK
eukprot:gene9380-11115_t